LRATASEHWIRGTLLRRQPPRGPPPAVNWMRFPGYAGLYGSEDDGTCQISMANK